jgi:hypothetical protein
MSKPTPEYYQAKADLCEKLAIQQIWAGNTDMGMRNIMRMTHALAELQLTEREGECDVCEAKDGEPHCNCGNCDCGKLKEGDDE